MLKFQQEYGFTFRICYRKCSLWSWVTTRQEWLPSRWSTSSRSSRAVALLLIATVPIRICSCTGITCHLVTTWVWWRCPLSCTTLPMICFATPRMWSPCAMTWATWRASTWCRRRSSTTWTSSGPSMCEKCFIAVCCRSSEKCQRARQKRLIDPEGKSGEN